MNTLSESVPKISTLGKSQQCASSSNELGCRSSGVEHSLGKREVAGSNPAGSTILLTPTQVARFWSKVDVGRDGACWAWQASTDRYGYGQFKPSSKHNPMRAHRVAYELVQGDAAGSLVLHSCGNAACCNPNHLRLGDQAENHADRVRHGRGNRSARGNWERSHERG